MNVIDILMKMGYDIVSINDGVYGVQYILDRKKYIWEQIEQGEVDLAIKKYLNETIYLCVGEVCFNEVDNLFVEFLEAKDKGSIWECYEYRNRDSSDLYG